MDDAGHIISLDLETLGSTPGCAVLTVGIAVLRLGTGTVLHEEEIAVSLEDQLAAGLRVEASTLRWWAGQSDEARRRAFPLATLRLHEAAARVAAVMGVFAKASLCAGVYGWGADFDLPILAALVRAGGIDGPLFTDYRLGRCGRTLCDAAQREAGPRRPAPHRAGGCSRPGRRRHRGASGHQASPHAARAAGVGRVRSPPDPEARSLAKPVVPTPDAVAVDPAAPAAA